MLLLQSTARTWPATAVHDTVARVLREAAFRRSVQQSFADVFMLWLADWFGRFMRIIKHVPSGRSIAIGLGALIVIAVVARAVLATRARGESAERPEGGRREYRDPEDSAAHELLSDAASHRHAAAGSRNPIVAATG